jgi:hypothetical protein
LVHKSEIQGVVIARIWPIDALGKVWKNHFFYLKN